MIIKDAKQLKHKKARDETGLFMIEGAKFVQEIPANWQVVEYFVAQHFAKNDANIVQKLEQIAPCTIVRDSIFESMADTVSPQGVIAICQKQHFDIKNIIVPNAFIVLGENLNDPGNIGALIRTAAAAGAHGMVLTQGSGDVYNPKVIRAAAGAVLRLPVVTGVNLCDVAVLLKQNQIPIYAAHPRGQHHPYSLNLKDSFCLLIGNEAHGVTPMAESVAENLVTLPMANNTESLNASVAGSILMYEALRQRL